MQALNKLLNQPILYLTVGYDVDSDLGDIPYNQQSMSSLTIYNNQNEEYHIGNNDELRTHKNEIIQILRGCAMICVYDFAEWAHVLEKHLDTRLDSFNFVDVKYLYSYLHPDGDSSIASEWLIVEPFKIIYKLLSELTESNPRSPEYFFSIRNPYVTKAFYRMRKQGLPIDIEVMRNIYRQYNRFRKLAREELLKRMKLIDEHVDESSVDNLDFMKEFFFVKLDLPPASYKDEKGMLQFYVQGTTTMPSYIKYNLDESSLRVMETHGKHSDMLMYYRIYQSITNFMRKYCAANSSFISSIDDGVIHAHFDITKTGRPRTFSPCLLNLPLGENENIIELCKVHKIDEPIIWLKDAIRLNKGEKLVSFDYKAAEMFALAFYSQDENMLEALQDLDRDLHWECIEYCTGHNRKDLPKKFRQIGKGVNYKIPYGIAKTTLKNQLSLETGFNIDISFIAKIVNYYKSKFPKAVKQLERWKESPYFKGVFGSYRHYDESDKNIYAIKREKMNAPLQSLVADLLAKSILQIFSESDSIRIPIPLYDALYCIVTSDEQEQSIEKAMQQEVKYLGKTIKFKTEKH